MVNLDGSGSLMSNIGCVARSLGKSSLIDTKHSFIRLTRVSISPPVNAFAKRSLSRFDRQVSYPRVSSYVSTNPVMMLLLLMQFWIDRIGVVISALRDSLDCEVFLPVPRHPPCVTVAAA